MFRCVGIFGLTRLSIRVTIRSGDLRAFKTDNARKMGCTIGMVLKLLLGVFWLLVVPAAAGVPFLKNKRQYTIGQCLLTGYVFLFAAMEVLALAMIAAGVSLRVLVVTYGALSCCAAVWGLSIRLRRRALPVENLSRGRKKAKITLSMVLALLFIFVQIFVVTRFAHMDADDSFYVGTAVTDVQTNTIFSINPYTGYEYATLPSRYILSPFPVFLAVISQLMAGLHPAVTAHVVFPAVFLFVCYLVLFQYAKKWFPEDASAQGLFMLFSAVGIWFSGYSIYSSGNFQMVRIWQGKALMAGAFLPFLFYLCMDLLFRENAEYSWVILLMTNMACCLLSSMGIILAPLMTGIFLLLHLLKNRRIKGLIRGIGCCVPSLVLGVVYFVIR